MLRGRNICFLQMLRMYKVPSCPLFPVDVVLFLGGLIWCPPPVKLHSKQKGADARARVGTLCSAGGSEIGHGQKNSKGSGLQGSQPLSTMLVGAGNRAGGFTLPNPFTESE